MNTQGMGGDKIKDVSRSRTMFRDELSSNLLPKKAKVPISEPKQSLIMVRRKSWRQTLRIILEVNTAESFQIAPSPTNTNLGQIGVVLG